MNRRIQLSNLKGSRPFDVVVIGGGVSGAPLYSALCQRGYRVALLDKGDFASGTSQASGMMVWGGLLYLKQMDLLTVRKLCAARDELVKSLPGTVSSKLFRFLPAQNGGQNPMFVMMGLYLYWLLGDTARNIPFCRDDFAERNLVRDGKVKTSLMFEEAFLKHSDSRYVLDWIAPFNSENNVPLNYCPVIAGSYDPSEGLWQLDIHDELQGNDYHITSRCVINCCGIWTDMVNQMLGIESSYRHVMSKGVYINLPRPKDHQTPLIFEMDDYDDVITYVPWGPVSMWGPTETAIDEIGPGLKPDVEDIRFLLNGYNRNLKSKIGPDSIVSLRCGIRPLAVDKAYSKSEYPLELSRKYAINHDTAQRAISIYGGKLTTSASLADKVMEKLDGLKPTGASVVAGKLVPDVLTDFPGVPSQVTPEWARDHELCCTLEDYLRRRTNIAQWTPRQGLGREDEHCGSLLEMAEAFSHTAGKSAQAQLDELKKTVINEYDSLLKSV